MALDRIGALWRKTKDEDGKTVTYFSGQIELTVGQPVRVVVMPFQRQKGQVKKSNGEDPAYTILLATNDKKKENDQSTPAD